MAIHKVPEFLSVLPKAEKERLMKQYVQWKKWEISELFVKHLERKLDKLALEDDKFSPASWFEFKWKKAERKGQRLELRKLINDLKE